MRLFYECCPDPYLDESLLFKTLPFTIQEFLPSAMRCSKGAVLIPTWTIAYCSRVYILHHSGVPAERHEVFYECCPDPFLDKSLLLKSIPFVPFRRSCRAK
jgi:hypothetical protein